MATRYSYPIDLHEEREGGYSVSFPDFDEAFTDGDTVAEAVAEARRLPGGGARGPHRAAREDIPVPSAAKGRPAVTPGAVLAAKAALFTRPCAKSGSPTAPSQWPWAFRKARFAACSTPATPPRSAGWRKPWRDSESASSSPWKRPPDCGPAAQITRPAGRRSPTSAGPASAARAPRTDGSRTVRRRSSRGRRWPAR